jgi:putative ABC transport system permease protein
MSFFTALSLSLNNLMTKKARTFLTAFAGSIGIIGIALILSLSSGIQEYIDDVQRDTLTSYPITIQKETMDMTAMVETMSGHAEGEDHSDEEAIYSNDVMVDVMGTVTQEIRSNNLKDFKKYIEKYIWSDIKNITFKPVPLDKKKRTD